MTKFLKIITFVTITSFALIAIAFSGAYLYLAPTLPDAESLTEIKLQIPLRIYSADGKLLGEFGDKKRTPVKIKNVPPLFIDAFLAAEDDRFYQHKGYSLRGLGRALLQAISGSSEQTGGSTITQQVVKNYLLTSERSIIRKLRELFLSVQIERFLSKDEILELYLNKIFLGHQSYGIAAAAFVYYGKTIDELSLAEMAVIASLPKAPSSINPISNPKEAENRRNWVLHRMLNLNFIDEAQYKTALKTPIAATKHNVSAELEASYAAEMARQEMVKRFGEGAYTDNYTVYTTINSALQDTAQKTVRKGLEDYDKRHGYRKPESHLNDLSAASKKALFNKIPSGKGIEAALVTQAEGTSLTVEISSGESINIAWENGPSTARLYASENYTKPSPKKVTDIFTVGDVIRIKKIDNAWHLTQIPKLEAALISLNPKNGAINAIVGGYGFYNNQFNRATQARRLVGSNIKPFIYAYALTQGYTAATIIDDSPIIYRNPYTGVVWQPSNDDGKFLGPTRLRQALYRSRNIVSIKILQAMGVKPTAEFITKFGFEDSQLPKEMSLALGTASFAPIQVATAYSTFANQGYKITPYLIDKIYQDNKVVFQEIPETVCSNCKEADTSTTNTEAEDIDDLLKESDQKTTVDSGENKIAKRIIDQRIAFIIDSILTDTIQKGTATRALSLGRKDISGKTATTNGPTDAWFSGYHPNIITTVWCGFDNNTPLGRTEYGSTIALPIWIDFMQEALKDQPVILRDPPAGIVSVLINSKNGKRTQPDDPNAMFEYIQEEKVDDLPTNNASAPITTEEILNLF